MPQRILIVEDTADTRELLAFILTKHGFDVLEAENGYQGLKIARNEPPDLIVMDMSMPVMDGIFTTQLLKSYENTKDIPVIALTAFDNYYHDRALQAGCEEVLTKPIEAVPFVETISRYLN